MTKKAGTKVLWAIGIVLILIATSVTFYLLLMSGDKEPLMSMKFSDKVLLEAGATEIGEDHSVESLNQFAVDIYKELAKNNSENLFFSPLSLYIALSMAMEGAKGETFTAMRAALRIVDNNATRRGSFASIQNHLNSRKGCELSLSNNVWIGEDFPINQEFNDTIRDFYMASIFRAPFSSDPEGVRNKINGLISDQTRGMIKELIPPNLINPETVSILTNAIYFKGEWKHGFDPDDTDVQYFEREDGKLIQTQMMNINPDDKKERITFKSSCNDTLEALRMDYKGGDISMLCLLPGGWNRYIKYDEDNLSEFENIIDKQYISDTNNGLENEKVAIGFPKFSFDTVNDMKPPLIKLGMGISFDSNADFSGIYSEMVLDETIQKACITVDESGTEAAAATYSDGACSMPHSIFFNRPFIFLIQDNATGLILFMGRIMDPTK